MTDPLDELRGLEADVRTPSVADIRARVDRTRRRRQGALGGAAALIAVVATVALLALPGSPDRTGSELATGRDAPTPAATAGTQAQDDLAARAATPVPAPQAASGVEPAEPDREGTSGGGSPGSAPVLASGEGSPHDALRARVEAPTGPVPPGGEARFVLHVCNGTGHAVEAFFRDAQRFDFEVFRDGARQWRWSDGMAFGQATGTEHWGPGECRSWDGSWSTSEGPAPPGRYEVVGLLTIDPPLRSAPEAFCVGACP